MRDRRDLTHDRSIEDDEPDTVARNQAGKGQRKRGINRMIELRRGESRLGRPLSWMRSPSPHQAASIEHEQDRSALLVAMRTYDRPAAASGSTPIDATGLISDHVVTQTIELEPISAQPPWSNTEHCEHTLGVERFPAQVASGVGLYE